MILTDEERRRFIEYCEAEVTANTALIAQFGKLPGLAMDLIAARYKLELAAFRLVAEKLKNVETQTLTPKQ